MQLVTSDSLKDFQTCSLLFEYRHLEKLPEKINEIVSDEEFFANQMTWPTQ